MNLRKLAKGHECLVRLPGCLGHSETVVLCHIRLGGIAGMGQKPPDLCGFYGCMACHNLVDGRQHMANLTRQEIEQAVLRGLLRTLVLVSQELELA